VQAFFTDRLARQRRASPQTVAGYRDTFRLLLQHLSKTTGSKPSDLTLDDLPAKAIVRSLDAIEQDRGNSVQTRNARLAAIRSFFRLVTLREPARIDWVAQVLAIPVKHAGRRLIGYLTRPEVDAIVATNTQTWIGRRDYALLLTLYNGARISEILALRQHSLWRSVAVIALWLGHESLDTTHMYIQADLKTKEQALGKLQPVAGGFPRFKPDDALLAFRSAL
jgi:site-specific recombinase XerD